jgi:site-specific recombinase XerD
MKVKARLLCRSGKDEGSIQIVGYFGDQQKEVALGRKIVKSDWDSERGLAKGHDNQMINIQIRNAIRDITAAIDNKLIKREPVILSEIFTNVFSPTKTESINDIKAEITLQKFIADFISENPDKIDQGTMNSYRSLLKSIKTFDKSKVLVKNVDVEFVNNLYNFFEKQGLKPSTIQTKFKKLKKIVNTANIRGLTNVYPFGKGKLSVPNPKQIKRKFLTNEETQRLIAYSPLNESEHKVMKIIKFNLHVGLRIGDIFTLRKNNIILQNHPIKGEIFRLSKTTSKTETDINIMLTTQAKQQILEGGFEKLDSQDLIFPWLSDADFSDDFTLYKAISAKTAYFNKILNNICKVLEIKHISSHSLRHTFCTTLISKGVPITSISKMVGHSDVSTTMIYAHIVQDTVDEAISVLEQ